MIVIRRVIKIIIITLVPIKIVIKKKYNNYYNKIIKVLRGIKSIK